MTTRPDHAHDLIHTALARIAPHRLGEMEQHKEQALGAALQDGRIGHLQYWLSYWRAQVEIERRADLRSRYQAALVSVHDTDSGDDPEFRAAMAELRAVETEARQAVST